ncbi:sentrin-specific protease 7 isoform X1 [Hirundo rustica]|uniref:sentrin-specific protease 7 isoform X1 n=1 Tax=Hirundo rustica TaxID=43150 RepID=UPI001A94367B|nr:sentrin-specific protease 7 isoform X1 [Hirundo rustica]XP_039911023.1 sentrin-specific protease 7 isoform X1 [Hirundo rustica]XP_039911024.1 sentrin-specific protease 7 isoform X1 [Hirundo rustica]XP_039911026.1 sentrin-specific protease 7 isoform X1 [Hirundo rustica]XP_039911027.1 sentrin-specific protease 7 isoform X1 [Hirundo rustica]XP_039911028.1 sentrin-specific protease 7 isoform X1 [Hirundo rustica]
MSGRTSSSSHVSFRIPKKKTDTKSEDVQVQSPLARLPGSHHCDYPLKEWRLSANNRKPSTKGKKQKDCNRRSCSDEESIGQPRVILTNVLRMKIGRKYTQAQPKTGVNFSDAGKLQSDQAPSSSAASIKIWQILNPALQSLFLSKRQPKVILTNVLSTKIGRKYIDSHVIIDANLPAADKLQSGQLPSSAVASIQTCQILSSPHESSFLSERSERCLRKTDDELCKLTKASKELGKINAVTLRRRELQKKENKHCGELEKSRRMNSTTLSQKESGSFDSEKRKRRHSGHISDDCNAHIPQKSLVLSQKQSLSSVPSPGCGAPSEDGQDHRSNPILVPDCAEERDSKGTSTHNHSPPHSHREDSASGSPPRNSSKKQLSVASEDVISPQVSTIRKLKMDKSEYLSKLRNRICRGNQQLVSIDPIILSSDDEDGPSESQCTELMQEDITENKETDQQSDFCFSVKQLEDKMRSLTEQFLAESIEDKCSLSLPSGSTPRKQRNLALDVEFDRLHIGKFRCLSTGPATFTMKNIVIPFQVSLKSIQLTVDTLDVRRFGWWKSDGGCSSTIIFLWLSVDYVEKIETQMGKLVTSRPSKSNEFVFFELSQPLTELEEDRLTELITAVSRRNRAPDLAEFLSLKQALPLFKDLSPEESSFMSCNKDMLKQYMPKENTSDAHESVIQESKLKVIRPSYALANRQNSGCYCISLSSALNEEWKEVREMGAVKNLIVYPPPPAKGGLGVTREDLECLEYGEFLNDVIIDFYLKYLLLEKAPKHVADRTHIFSSFFYKCLTRTEKNSEGDVKVSAAQRRHRRVRTWTRHINIFNKDYIFVPVNEESHWYIAVICFPWLEEAVYEECPRQNSLSHRPQQAPLEPESENTRAGSVLFKDEEEMDGNRSLFPKAGGNEVGASASVLYSAISKISLSNSKKQICKRPCILILDSLKACSVQKTVQVLREYLEVEWEAKRKTHREFSKSTMIDLCPKVPKQDNSSDCGVYLLQYVESFFQNPIVNFEQALHLENWFPRQLIRNKREEIRDLILQLHFQQQSGSSS